MAEKVSAEQLVAFRRERDARAARHRAQLLETALSTEDGRELLAVLIYEFGALDVLHFSGDPSYRDFHQGQRSVGAALRAEVRKASPLWQQMENERTDRLAREESEPALEADD